MSTTNYEENGYDHDLVLLVMWQTITLGAYKKWVQKLKVLYSSPLT